VPLCDIDSIRRINDSQIKKAVWELSHSLHAVHIENKAFRHASTLDLKYFAGPPPRPFAVAAYPRGKTPRPTFLSGRTAPRAKGGDAEKNPKSRAAKIPVSCLNGGPFTASLFFLPALGHKGRCGRRPRRKM
jgi:hypothetical protein